MWSRLSWPCEVTWPRAEGTTGGIGSVKGARYSGPTIGRFNQRDLLWSAGQLNPYAYANWDLVKYTGPTPARGAGRPSGDSGSAPHRVHDA
jgi:hypothetical protein